MMNTKRTNILIVCASVLGLGIIVATAACFGVLMGTRIAATNGLTSPLPLHAGTAAKGKTMSMATGLIDGEVEGLYVLDHLSGNLQCWILNSRTGAVAGIYRANVLQDLQSDKVGEIDYVMTTGNFFFTGGIVGNVAPSNSVVYIADESTGNVVGYHLSYDKQAIRRGIAQAGLLQLVCKGPTRGATTVRDQ